MQPWGQCTARMRAEDRKSLASQGIRRKCDSWPGIAEGEKSPRARDRVLRFGNIVAENNYRQCRIRRFASADLLS